MNIYKILRDVKRLFHNRYVWFWSGPVRRFRMKYFPHIACSRNISPFLSFIYLQRFGKMKYRPRAMFRKQIWRSLTQFMLFISTYFRKMSYEYTRKTQIFYHVNVTLCLKDFMKPVKLHKMFFDKFHERKALILFSIYVL